MTDWPTYPETDKPNLLANVWDKLAKALAIPSFNPFVPTHQRKERRYTRAYADGRQKKGRGLYALEQKRIAALHKPARPAPAPSAKALKRRKLHV